MKTTEFEKTLKLAELGYSNAQFELGFLYAYGEGGLDRDLDKALKWSKLAAEQGHPEAQFCLGLMYDQGLGVEQDDDEAFEWFKMAADQGHKDAQYFLGDFSSKFSKMLEEQNKTDREV